MKIKAEAHGVVMSGVPSEGNNPTDPVPESYVAIFLPPFVLEAARRVVARYRENPDPDLQAVLRPLEIIAAAQDIPARQTIPLEPRGDS